MNAAECRKRASLEGLAGNILKLVAHGATPEQWSEWLRVPLEHAAADGDIDLFNALIGAGADGSAGWRGCHGRTLFDAAAVGGNAEVVFGLVAAGAQPDVNVVSASSGMSALFLATSLGHEDAARRLVLAGADVHFREPGGLECDILVKAVEGGCEELVKDLLIGGANPNKDWRCTPLHTAAGYGFEGIVSSLLARGADKDARDLTGCTALEMAARVGHIGVVKTILGHGADVNAVDTEGCTALHCTAVSDQAGAIDVLVEAGADIELKNSDGRTPLCVAAYSAHCTSLRSLLHHGANSDVRDNDGETLLHLVCHSRDEGLDTALDVLLRCGADETAVNNDGKTPAQELDMNQWFSPETTGRARLLLARAPNDRAWRRRCWLVMLGSRASRARTAGWDNGGVCGRGSNAADSRAKSGGSKMARSEHAGRGGSGAVAKAGSNGCAIGFGGEGGGLGSVVASLIGLELEGVFRKVVGFL